MAEAEASTAQAVGPTDRAVGPQDPTEVSAEGWRATLERTRRRLKRDRVSVSAGSLAYHGFLAFFPAIIAALGVITLIHLGLGTVHHLTHGLEKGLPAGASGVFKGAVSAATKRSAGSLAAVVIGILVALWSASSAMAVLQQALDVAYGVPVDRKFLARRVRGLGLMVVTGLLGGLAAILIVFGQPIASAIRGVVPISGTPFVVGWTLVRWIVAAAVITVLFSIYYYFGPNRKPPRWRWVSPGGLLAAGVFLAASLGFSYYISTFGNYGKTYGSFAGVAIFIFWMYLSAFAVLLGGEVNAQLERQAAAESTGVRTNGAAGRPVAGYVPGPARPAERPEPARRTS